MVVLGGGAVSYEQGVGGEAVSYERGTPAQVDTMLGTPLYLSSPAPSTINHGHCTMNYEPCTMNPERHA